MGLPFVAKVETLSSERLREAGSNLPRWPRLLVLPHDVTISKNDHERRVALDHGQGVILPTNFERNGSTLTDSVWRAAGLSSRPP